MKRLTVVPGLGARLRTWRAARQWSLNRLARHTGLSPNTLSLLEMGVVTDPRLSTLIVLARAFSCSLDALVGRDPGPEVWSNDVPCWAQKER